MLLPCDVNAYRISLKPCGPGLLAPARPAWVVIASAVNPSTTNGMVRMTSDAIFISNASIFLPRYSGVRPTISPATNTAMIAKISMPYSPEPTPPKITSPSCIIISGTSPPSGV